MGKGKRTPGHHRENHISCSLSCRMLKISPCSPASFPELSPCLSGRKLTLTRCLQASRFYCPSASQPLFPHGAATLIPRSRYPLTFFPKQNVFFSFTEIFSCTIIQKQLRKTAFSLYIRMTSCILIWSSSYNSHLWRRKVMLRGWQVRFAPNHTTRLSEDSKPNPVESLDWAGWLTSLHTSPAEPAQGQGHLYLLTALPPTTSLYFFKQYLIL